MRIRLDIGKVIILLYESYKDAVKNPMVNKPISYALYEVWKYADNIERPREKVREQKNV